MIINIPADMLAMGIMEHAPNLDDADDVRRALKSYIAEITAHKPEIVMLNVNYKRSAVHSDVFDTVLHDIATASDGRAYRDPDGNTLKTYAPVEEDVEQPYFNMFLKIYRRLLKNGIDVFEMAIAELRARGAQAWFSIRMNDHHCYQKHMSVMSGFIFHHLDTCALAPGKGVLPGQYMNYASPQVRVRMLEYIEELLTRYDIDGLELDWLRSAPVLDNADRADIISDFMLNVRALTKMPLGARVKAFEAQNLNDGLDAAGWIADSALNLLTISNFFVPTCFDFPVARWRESILRKNMRAHTYRLACGMDWAVCGAYDKRLFMSPELIRGFADGALAAGADDVYLFNIAARDPEKSNIMVNETTGELWDGFSERLKAGAGGSGNRSYAHVDGYNVCYPIRLAPGQAYKFAMHTGTPAQSARLIAGLERAGELGGFVNCASITFAPIKAPPGVAYRPDAVWVRHVREVAPYVACATLDTANMREGANEYMIINKAESELLIDWLSVDILEDAKGTDI